MIPTKRTNDKKTVKYRYYKAYMYTSLFTIIIIIINEFHASLKQNFRAANGW